MKELKEDSTTETVTKAHLGEQIYEKIGFNKREAKEMVDEFFKQIAASLVAGAEVKLSGFGVFKIRDKSPRPGRNPRTKELVPIDARRVVTFHSSQILKDVVLGKRKVNKD